MTRNLFIHAVCCAPSNERANGFIWKFGEVTELAESTGLENRRRATYRGFESHPLRQTLQSRPSGRFFYVSKKWIRTHGYIQLARRARDNVPSNPPLRQIYKKGYP